MMSVPAGLVWTVATGVTGAVTMPTVASDPVIALAERLGVLGSVLVVGWVLIQRQDRREDKAETRKDEINALLVAQLEAERTIGRQRAADDRKRHDAEIADLRREIADLRAHARELTDRLIVPKEGS